MNYTNFDLNKDILTFINGKAKNEFDPYYVYDSNMIRDHCRIFQNIAYENKSIHFASMANIHPRFLSIVKEEKVNVFVGSLLHLEVAQEAGFSKEEIYLPSSALTEKTIKRVHQLRSTIKFGFAQSADLWEKIISR